MSSALTARTHVALVHRPVLGIISRSLQRPAILHRLGSVRVRHQSQMCTPVKEPLSRVHLGASMHTRTAQWGRCKCSNLCCSILHNTQETHGDLLVLGIAGTAVPAEIVQAEDEKPQAAPEADSPPRPVIKPRRDRKVCACDYFNKSDCGDLCTQ